MNKILITLAALLTWCVGNAHAATIGISDVTINAGASKTVELTFPQVSSGVAGFQFDVEIPQQVELVGDNVSQQFVFDAYLTDIFAINVNHQGDNTYRIMAYSPTVSMVTLNGTEKISFVLKADKKAVTGSYIVKVKDIVLSDANGVATKLQGISGNVTIMPPVRVAANNKICVYGDDYGELSYNISSCYTTGMPTISCEATQVSSAGVYDIIVGKGTLDTDTITFVNGTLTVTKAPLKIRAKNYTIKQGKALPAFEADYEGFKNGDTPTNLVSGPSFTTTAIVGCNPGEYTINVTGAESGNYNISYESGLLTVTNADAIIIRARSYSRQYGEDNPEFGYDVDGTELIGTPEIRCAATSASSVGTYDIVISKGSVGNYNDTYVNGTLTITKAPLTIAAGNYTKEEGEDNPKFAPVFSGFKNNETESVLTKQPTVSTTATKDSHAGEYDIIVSGAEAQNYSISYQSGTLTVTDKPIELETIEGETSMNTDELGGQDLSNNVVGNIYYVIGENGYDVTDKSIVISQTTNMGQIADKEPGSADVKENFNGMILKVAKGKGLITVNAKTSGNAQLVVQVGNGTPMFASKTEKGDVVFSYDVEEDTYVYIYAIIGSSAAKGYSVRIYSITVSPGATGIRSIGSSEKNDDIIYDLQGRRVKNTAKGVYIVGGRKYSVK
ncbi:MAG: hypothetical protein IKP84_06835 [Prevotella sp.]|nr:hypothetical protein [Prevotella sp.]